MWPLKMASESARQFASERGVRRCWGRARLRGAQAAGAGAGGAGGRGGAGAGRVGGRLAPALRWVNPRQVVPAAAAAAAAGFGGRPSASFLPASSAFARLVTM